MTQINFRIDDEIEEFILLMSKLEGKSKTNISKDIFMNGLNSTMMPYLANLYKEGKISIKHIAKITKIHPMEIMNKVAQLIDDIEINPDLIEFSEEIGKKLLPYLKNAKDAGFSLKGTINTQES
jgi:predicted HTH domain antitoxin